MNITKIIKAWKISFKPTEYESEIARLRLNVCRECPSRVELSKKIKLLNVCSECGCPVEKKAFTSAYNPCPLGKWGEIDKPYFGEQKTKKSLI